MLKLCTFIREKLATIIREKLATRLLTRKHEVVVSLVNGLYRMSQKSLLLKVVDLCWISSTEWSDTLRIFFCIWKEARIKKKKYIITVQKNFTFLRRFDHKNTVLGIS